MRLLTITYPERGQMRLASLDSPPESRRSIPASPTAPSATP